MRFYLVWGLTALVFLSPPRSEAQTNDPRGPALSAVYGPFLVAEIPRVDEVLPLCGLRFGHRFWRSQVEYGALMARAHGIRYERLDLTFRNPVGGGPIVAHWLLGLHLDHYKPRLSTVPGRSNRDKWSSGWQVGAGWRGALTNQLSFRNDYIWGKSPGSSLHVQVGLEYFFRYAGSP